MKGIEATTAAMAAMAFVLAPPPVAAQETVGLGDPVAESAEPFSAVAGLREMSDGTLLLSDGLEGRLLRVSRNLASAATIGRKGAGPREYETPDALYAMAADSTLMVDLGNGRLSVLAPDASIVRTLPIAGGSGQEMTIMLPGAVDAAGRVFFRQMEGPGAGPPDSATVARYDPATDRTASIARIKLPEMSVRTRGGSHDREEVMRPVPLSPQDAWIATPDGRLAVARSAGGAYWIEIHGLDGVTRGPRIEYEPVPVRDDDKQAWIAALAGALGISVEVENGRRRTTFSRGGAPPMEPDDLEWPETKPPFPAGALHVGPGGRFWVERHVAAGRPRTFDVLDPAGRRIGSVRLPEGRRLEGFGDDAVYLSRTDPLDFVWLERYGLPAL
ncbi:MAG TPA: hypothetical protein VLA33_12375 [Gemmatimonadota bacterium]|nr:hypothetical protein [Gemmatimonadota bacterium]